MATKSYAEYLAGEAESYKRIMAKHGAGPVPRAYSGDTSLINGTPVDTIKHSVSLEERPIMPDSPRPRVFELRQMSLLEDL